MKVTIHISHTEADDLGLVTAAAQQLGWTVNAQGGFMGRHHTELKSDMDASMLVDLLEQTAQAGKAAA